MTTERKYRCNICKDEINDKNPGIGFLFKSANTELEGHACHLAENHLCCKCMRAISNIYNGTKPCFSDTNENNHGL